MIVFDEYSKERGAPKELSGLLIKMNELSLRVSNIKDAPKHCLYQEIVALVYALNRYFLTCDANIEKIEELMFCLQ